MSKCELIELKDLSVNDPIELAAPAARTAPPPANPGQPSHFHVVRLVGDSVSIEAPWCQTGEPAVGHDFQPYSFTHLTWCDLCGEFIWGLYKQSLRCTNCSYTCHYRCRPFIQLDCSTDGSLLPDQEDFSVDSIETDTNVGGANGNAEVKRAFSTVRSLQTEVRCREKLRDSFQHCENSKKLCQHARSLEMTWGSKASDTFCSQEDSSSDLELYFTAYTSFFHKVRRPADEQIDWSKQELTVGDIQHKVKEYNAQVNSNLYMVVNKDGSYTGFIKVHFQLVRPISLPHRQSLCSTQEDDQQDRRLRRRTSFYLPKDTAKHLHISSQTRVREVIEALLNKFTVVDNPAKFALFERTERQSQVCLRKLSDDECPLYLRLCAGPSEKVLSLVLKENETGDVNWDAFSFPELCNFLRILKREEEERVRQIVKRYALARDMMKQAMARITTPG